MKDKIIKFLLDGLSYNEIVKELGCSKATISFHAQKIGLRTPKKRPTYDWVAIQKHYNKVKSIKLCKEKFGFSDKAWYAAVEKGLIVPVLIQEIKETSEIKSKTTLRSFIKRNGLLKHECQECGLGPVWNNKPLVLHIDHINGINNDHRLENLRYLCPNCHSQTETYAYRNAKRKKLEKEVQK
jgi:transposase-like protein